LIGSISSDKFLMSSVDYFIFSKSPIVQLLSK